jgi:hypothetical protein
MSEKFWGLLELMGHRRLAGEIVKDDGGLIRIDLPSGETQWYGTSAVYCITPTTEETARGMAARIGLPIGVYDARQVIEDDFAEREQRLEERERALLGIKPPADGPDGDIDADPWSDEPETRREPTDKLMPVDRLEHMAPVADDEDLF